MNHPYRGVLLPTELRDTPQADRDRYVETTLQRNRAFVAAYFTLEDDAARLGLTMDDLEDRR
jgi:hypothetical protein